MMSQTESLTLDGHSAAHVGDADLPLDVVVPGSGPLTEQRQRQLIWWLLAVGVAARAVRYLLKFPLWDDECFLMANLLDRGYGQLTEPLNYWQVCPIGFLWLELSLVKVFGFSEYVLRLPSFVCGIAGLFLFRHLAGRLLRGTALVLAVGTFAVAYPLIRYSAEAKPYGIDMFLALVLVAMTVQWWVAGVPARPDAPGGAEEGSTDDSAERRLPPGESLAAESSVPRSGKRYWTVQERGLLLLRNTDDFPKQSTVKATSLAENHRCHPGNSTGETPVAPNRWLWAMAVLVPVAVVLSYPVVFIAGGVSLFVAYVLWRRGGSTGWMPWIVYNVVLLAAFVAVFALSVQPQSTTELDSMRTYWQRGFPPLANPIALVGWFFNVHTGQMLAYPVGGDRGGSTLTFILSTVGLILLARRRQYTLLLLLLAPLVLTFVAAVLGRYPYGGMVRFNIYMAPAFCLLAGLGLAALLVPRRRAEFARGRAGVLIAAGVLLAVAVGSIARDVAFPAKAAVDMRFRDFARWFWFDMAHDGELVCLKSDLDKSFSTETFRHGFSAMYLCNQRIYSPRHARGGRPRWERISADWPLRCVQFRSASYPFDEAAFEGWLAEMQRRYTLVGRERYPFACYDKRETKIRTMTYVEVYKFVPKQEDGASATAERPVGDKRR